MTDRIFPIDGLEDGLRVRWAFDRDRWQIVFDAVQHGGSWVTSFASASRGRLVLYGGIDPGMRVPHVLCYGFCKAVKRDGAFDSLKDLPVWAEALVWASQVEEVASVLET